MQAFTQFWQMPVELRAKAADRLMAETSIDDQTLLRRLARGDEEAFHILYDRYQRRIYRFAWHVSGDQAAAEEITQEVFMILIRKPAKYDSAKGPLGGYLFGITRHLINRRMEQRRNDVPLQSEPADVERAHWHAEAEIDNRVDILKDLTQRELIEALRKAVLSLPLAYREVIILCDLEQVSQARAAELLECSPGTIASRMHRARAMLKMKMAGKSEQP
jgi:RNA polymerase sigma-70 factor (ECF subfamily)